MAILGALAGFNVLDSLVGSGLLYVLSFILNGPSSIPRMGLIAAGCGFLAGAIGAIACPLFVLRKVLRNNSSKAYLVAMCILAIILILPLPAPFIYVLY